MLFVCLQRSQKSARISWAKYKDSRRISASLTICRSPSIASSTKIISQKKQNIAVLKAATRLPQIHQNHFGIEKVFTLFTPHYKENRGHIETCWIFKHANQQKLFPDVVGKKHKNHVLWRSDVEELVQEQQNKHAAELLSDPTLVFQSVILCCAVWLRTILTDYTSHTWQPFVNYS